jgi:hypothetical protein
MRKIALLPWVLVLALVLAPTAGAAQTMARSEGGNAAQPTIATSLVIEQFLRAANAKDIDTMARLFGTRDGSIVQRDKQKDVETRMLALAAILRHDDYAIEETDIVPGRRGEATQVMVRMTIGKREVRVPYTLVRGPGKNWLVEQIDIEQITNTR